MFLFKMELLNFFGLDKLCLPKLGVSTAVYFQDWNITQTIEQLLSLESLHVCMTGIHKCSKNLETTSKF